MSYLETVEALLAEELSPKRAAELAKKVVDAAPAPTAEEALAILAEVVGAAIPAKKAASAPKAKPAAKTKPAAPRARTRKPAAPAAATESAEEAPSGGTRNIAPEVREGMAAKKALYWAMYRKMRGDDPLEDDQARLDAASAEELKVVKAQIKEKLAKEAAKKAAAMNGGAATQEEVPAEEEAAPALPDVPPDPPAPAADPGPSGPLSDTIRKALGV